MKEITQIEGQTCEIWRRFRQRHMNLRVRPDGNLRITCGKMAPRAEIAAFVRDSAHFIARERERFAQYPPKKFVSEETFLYLGQRLPLQVIWSWGLGVRVRILGDQVEMTAPLASSTGERQKAWHNHLRRQARKILTARVDHFSRAMALRPRSVSIRGQRTRWGSCSSEGNVNLNWKLLSAPAEVIDYVVVHELAHLRHMDHSPRFWRLVESHFPEHRLAKAWLRDHEMEIGAQFQILPAN